MMWNINPKSPETQKSIKEVKDAVSSLARLGLLSSLAPRSALLISVQKIKQKSFSSRRLYKHQTKISGHAVLLYISVIKKRSNFMQYSIKGQIFMIKFRNHTALGCRDFSSLDCRSVRLL